MYAEKTSLPGLGRSHKNYDGSTNLANREERRRHRSSGGGSRQDLWSDPPPKSRAEAISHRVSSEGRSSRNPIQTEVDLEPYRQQSQLHVRDRTSSKVSETADSLRNMNLDMYSEVNRPKAMEVGSDRTTAETSRELRTRRLLEQQRERRNSKQSHEQIDTSILNPSPTHFPASSPAVEKYLSRKNMMDDIQCRSGIGRSGSGSDDDEKLQSLRRSSSLTKASPRDFLMAARSSQKATSTTDSNMQNTQKAPSSGNGSPANIVRSFQEANDEINKTLSSAVKGWSTFNSRLRRAVSPTRGIVTPLSKVDQYLANRHQQKQQTVDESKTSQFIRVPSFDTDAYLDGLQQSSESGEDEEEEEKAFIESSDDEVKDAAAWSVRVCVISAVDLPASVIPSLPLSPVLKLGLVSIPGTQDKKAGHLELSKKVDIEGLASFPRTKIRCTSSRALSQRDNGSAEFHEEMRWDNVRRPHQMALAVELASRAVLTPANSRESPAHVDTLSSGRPAGPGTALRFGAMFRKQQKKGSNTEMEQANAAAALAKLLVEENAPAVTSSGGEQSTESQERGPLFDSHSSVMRSLAANQNEVDVQLNPRKLQRRRTRVTEDLRLGSRIIPLESLDIRQAIKSGSVRVEQWIELDASLDTNAPDLGSPRQSSASKRSPSVLLEVTVARREVLNDSEDEMEQEETEAASIRRSYSKRASLIVKNQLKREAPVAQVKSLDDPILEPGIIDFACVMGARDIGDQKSDDGGRGWVNSNPECIILDRFPATDAFHQDRGRKATLAEKIEWFCFPEGIRLWRGTTPPNAEEMNLKRFSALSPGSMSSSTALFDAHLGCTTSFSWFVIASNSDEYGSELVKTYGAVIRFYVPAPIGIDPKQDDFAQFITDDKYQQSDFVERKRLWVPLAICLTSSLPIVGIMEAMLLRLCDALSISGIPEDLSSSGIMKEIAQVVVNFHRPIQGVVNCSIPFLSGDPFHVALPPSQGLPSLPHGNAISTVCRLLGADGLTTLLAALLTESKILLHSDDVANLCLVAEVVTALIYPFQWSLPYVPVLPAAMMEFIEAPMPYLLGIPSCNMKHIDPSVLEDVVVVNIDQGLGDIFESEQGRNQMYKSPTPLPLPVTISIERAVSKVVRAGEDAEAPNGNSRVTGVQTFPRMEPESAIEREFRLSIAIDICGLTRGLEECLVYASSSQPVFNVDKFLQIAPAMFEEQRGYSSKLHFRGEPSTQKVVSPMSRKFMSTFVNCQHFHQFLELVNDDRLALFHDIMEVWKAGRSQKDTLFQPLDYDTVVSRLSKTLKKREDKIPTFRILKNIDDKIELEPKSGTKRFPFDLLHHLVVDDASANDDNLPLSDGVKQVSVAYLVELEKNPWRYRSLFSIDIEDPVVARTLFISEKIKLRDAIGERRFQAWQMSKEDDSFSMLSEEPGNAFSSEPLDLKSLLQYADSSIEKCIATSEHSQKRNVVDDAKSRDAIRRCLQDLAASTGSEHKIPNESLVKQAEDAMRNLSAKNFFLNVLSQRKGSDSQRVDFNTRRRTTVFNTVSLSSKVENEAFDILVRLGCAILNDCAQGRDFETAAALLKLTAGLYTSVASKEGENAVVYMTSRIGGHHVYAELGVWESVMRSHLTARHETLKEDKASSEESSDVEVDEYEATISTLYEMVAYGIPAEELARFSFWKSQKNGWFKSEKGMSLLLLSKRLSGRREQGVTTSSSATISDIDSLGLSKTFMDEPVQGHDSQDSPLHWMETGWCHPAAKSARRLGASDTHVNAKRQGTQNILNLLDEQQSSQRHEKRIKRSAVTAMSYVGSSVVATGGLDGGVFLARRVRTDRKSRTTDKGQQDEKWDTCLVRGMHLDWGSSGSRFASVGSATGADGEFGVGAVSCLATTRAISHTFDSPTSKDTVEPPDEHDLLKEMDGCRVIAGTTCGDLRVWSIKDVFSAVFFAKGNESSKFGASGNQGADFAAGSSLTRLKFSLRGRALSGHRGGVSCVDVPSPIFRPDSIITGGADGLIKLWSLRSPSISGIGQRGGEVDPSRIVQSALPSSPRTTAARSGDALSILSGHGGRILCVKTAWHGDRLLSCGADRTVRVWDISGSGGRCINTLSGHFGWVTKVNYWGPHTIISASTDRSIALWDTRIRSTPLFALRHHLAPVSDILVGARTDPIIVSAGLDGQVAAWDFRKLNGRTNSSTLATLPDNKKSHRCMVIRNPIGNLNLRDHERHRHVAGTLLLSRASVRESINSVYCLGSDGTIREWDTMSGRILSEHVTGHSDAISGFCSVGQDDSLMDSSIEGTRRGMATTTISASWDGTVRLRRLVR
ncbi:hypothetical protein FisN_7Lh156 [Fistulifera solaris]|uniref:UDENN domain-containing protein n=1 Tax=Fistulifera solaris TaxID=1519565 RepID=A0A1Z5JCP4_FISSO|nr:hypothetical protein FisN_7Lh156 [Fistulifera solaris]|eukprot:GAX11774.1 hypothetical protein FisN_7Lh156 [Fistulifera solaris]